jgi:hypothetical protein
MTGMTLSRSTACRPTPIATTGFHFNVDRVPVLAGSWPYDS